MITRLRLALARWLCPYGYMITVAAPAGPPVNVASLAITCDTSDITPKLADLEAQLTRIRALGADVAALKLHHVHRNPPRSAKVRTVDAEMGLAVAGAPGLTRDDIRHGLDATTALAIQEVAP